MTDGIGAMLKHKLAQCTGAPPEGNAIADTLVGAVTGNPQPHALAQYSDSGCEAVNAVVGRLYVLHSIGHTESGTKMTKRQRLEKIRDEMLLGAVELQKAIEGMR